MSLTNKTYRLLKRPTGFVTPMDFTIGEEKIPDLKDKEVLVKTEFLSLDPTNRIWMTDMEQYMPPLELGEVIRAIGIGTVLKSRHSQFKEGDHVQGLLGWQTQPTLRGEDLTKLPPSKEQQRPYFLGPLGMTGLTAYFGLFDIAHPKKGETLVVSAAAGAVGSMVCQLGKIAGCQVIGIASSKEKCQVLTNELGVDSAIAYKEESVGERLKELCPKGIDIYFENVGGDILDAVLPRMNLFGRIPLCGLIAGYNATEAVPGPYQFGQILMKRITLRGFIITDYAPRFNEAVTELSKWLAAGKITPKVTEVKGFENLPASLNKLFSGDNVGKLYLEI